MHDANVGLTGRSNKVGRACHVGKKHLCGAYKSYVSRMTEIIPIATNMLFWIFLTQLKTNESRIKAHRIQPETLNSLRTRVNKALQHISRSPKYYSITMKVLSLIGLSLVLAAGFIQRRDCSAAVIVQLAGKLAPVSKMSRSIATMENVGRRARRAMVGCTCLVGASGSFIFLLFFFSSGFSPPHKSTFSGIGRTIPNETFSIGARHIRQMRVINLARVYGIGTSRDGTQKFCNFKWKAVCDSHSCCDNMG